MSRLRLGQMMLFIHGFGSCGWGDKSLLLRRHVGVDNILAPDLPTHPQAAFDHLMDLVSRYPIDVLVGSSLGGFFATALNAHVRLPAVLINPAVRPHLLLSRHLGPQRRWCDDMPFSVSIAFLDILKSLHRETLTPEERYLVLLQQGDEVLDYREAADYYRDKTVQLLPGGNHRFEDFDRQLPLIDRWLGRQAAPDT